jgi:predicted metal-dependent phosphoesterase TrpH
MNLVDIFDEAEKRGIQLISITDHDAIECQEAAMELAAKHHMHYLSGVELNISFSHPAYRDGKAVSLDVLGYNYDIQNKALAQKTHQLREYRKVRAKKILDNINAELKKENKGLLTQDDLKAIEKSVDGAFGRPHIADYLVNKGIVTSKQEAFDRYLVKCNVPKLPVTLEEASELVHGAAGKLMLAHPNDPNGTSLVSLTLSIPQQIDIIKTGMLAYLDGVECFHSRLSEETTSSYLAFAREEGLMVTGGSDCHQQPIIMGTIPVPDFVARQFDMDTK